MNPSTKQLSLNMASLNTVAALDNEAAALQLLLNKYSELMKIKKPDFNWEPTNTNNCLGNNEVSADSSSLSKEDFAKIEKESPTERNILTNDPNPVVETPKKATRVKPWSQLCANPPAQIIKVEDSENDESMNSDEMALANQVVHKLEASTLSNTLVHYVILENLPIGITAEQLSSELFNGLLGFSREEVAGLVMNTNNHESSAMLYLHDFRHVQRILAFSGKLVLQGRVMTCKLGMD